MTPADPARSASQERPQPSSLTYKQVEAALDAARYEHHIGGSGIHVGRLTEELNALVGAQERPPIDVEGVVAELVGIEAALEDLRRRLVRATDTLGGIARLSGSVGEP